MSLTRITSKPKARALAVYDLEWVPETYELRLAGLFDGTRYRAFRTIEAFLNAVLSPEWRSHVFLAHAGGLADMHFLLQKLETLPDAKVTAAFSGSSAIVVKVFWQGHVYTFLDSYWILRDKLAHLAPFTGIAKDRGAYKCAGYPSCGHVGRACPTAPDCGCEIGPEPLCMFRAPLPILKDYNERDCRILYAALSGFQDLLLEMGTELRSTVASTALGLFRTKYLRQTIKTNPARNDAMRAAYDASRVEVIRPRIEVFPASYYDVNSSFPFAMTHPCPGEYLGQSRKLPENAELYFADVTVSVPSMFLPPLPAKGKDGRTFFPTGRWRRLYARPDLELLLEAGGRIERVHEVTHFAPFTDLAAYALDLYERRAKAKEEGKLFLALVLKYLLNACYGKFGENREKQQLIIHPETEGCPHQGVHNLGGMAGATCVECLFPGCVLVTEERKVAHEHVAIAAHITAIARRTLYRHLASCGEDLYYCDTDSIVTGQTLPTGKALGELKLEYQITHSGRHIQPKLYEHDGHIKSKGFSRLSSEQFEDLIAGREVEVERMVRVREMAREMRAFGPASKKFGKTIRVGATRPKRRASEENETRPWTFKEIHERWKVA